MLKFIRVERNAALLIVLAGVLGLSLANTVPGLASALEPTHFYAKVALAVFFFVIGLELKVELTHGVFANRKAIIVPGLAALVGALVPAAFYFSVTFSDPIAANGWAIPMATDITIALAVFALFGSRMPKGSKQFLLAFAIIDDLLAILVIALFLRSDVMTALLVTGSAFVGLFFPAKMAEKIQHALLPLVNAVVLPFYAFSSLAVELNTTVTAALTSIVGLGVLFGIFGKSIGITLGAYLGSKFTKDALKLSEYFRLSVVGGIGFTVAFFVNDIIFKSYELFHTQAIMALLVAGIASVLLSAISLRYKLPKQPQLNK